MFIPLCLLCNARITFCFKMQKGFISFLKYLWVFASDVGHKIVPSCGDRSSCCRVDTWPAVCAQAGYSATLCSIITHSTLTDNQYHPQAPCLALYRKRDHSRRLDGRKRPSGPYCGDLVARSTMGAETTASRRSTARQTSLAESQRSIVQ